MLSRKEISDVVLSIQLEGGRRGYKVTKLSLKDYEGHYSLVLSFTSKYNSSLVQLSITDVNYVLVSRVAVLDNDFDEAKAIINILTYLGYK